MCHSWVLPRRKEAKTHLESARAFQHQSQIGEEYDAYVNMDTCVRTSVLQLESQLPTRRSWRASTVPSAAPWPGGAGGLGGVGGEVLGGWGQGCRPHCRQQSQPGKETAHHDLNGLRIF